MADRIIVGPKYNGELKTINTFKIVGTLLFKNRLSETAIQLTLAVKRPEDEAVYCIQVTFYGKEQADGIDAIRMDGERKPRLLVIGNYQTRKKTYGGETKYFKTFVGTRLEYAKTLMESATGIDYIGKKVAPAENEFCLVGPVSHTYNIYNKQNPEKTIGTIVTLISVINGVKNFPEIVCFGPQAAVARSLKKNDYVSIVGHAITNEKMNKGRKEFLTSVIADEIMKIDPEMLIE